MHNSTKSTIPVFNIVFDETQSMNGATVISLVKDPACEVDFMKFDNTKSISLSLNKKKNIITGVALRADYPIYREYEGEKFYVKFTPDVIEKFAMNFMKEKRTDVVSTDHNGKNIDGVYMFESFIMSDNHKLTYPEFYGVENGSWVVSYKVDNTDVWNRIEKGDIKGFSPEIDAYIEDKFKLESDLNKAVQLIEFINKYS